MYKIFDSSCIFICLWFVGSYFRFVSLWWIIKLRGCFISHFFKRNNSYCFLLTTMGWNNAFINCWKNNLWCLCWLFSFFNYGVWNFSNWSNVCSFNFKSSFSNYPVRRRFYLHAIYLYKGKVI